MTYNHASTSPIEVHLANRNNLYEAGARPLGDMEQHGEVKGWLNPRPIIWQS
jgi:hypothetical protein